jgi:hypothetical protein
MDTKIDEPEQGAAVAADLLQQDSQVEVVGSKPSVGPSDVERLSEVISTIRLQTKRLSGVQRKKLLKSKKMKEIGRLKNLQERLLHLRRRWWRKVLGV